MINTPYLVLPLDNSASIEREEEVVVCNIVRPPCGDRVLKEEEYLKRIFKLLKNSEMIELVGEYEPGEHGNKYKACSKHSQVVPVEIK